MNNVLIPILILLWVLFCCWCWNCVQKPTTSCGVVAIADTTTRDTGSSALTPPDTVLTRSAPDTVSMPTGESATVAPLTKEEEVLFRPLHVYFGSNQSAFRPDTAVDTFLSTAKKYLTRYPDKKLLITGHSDSDGSDALNMRLSIKRAEGMKRLLQKDGFKASQLITQGKGETDPIVPNDSPANKTKNRRVDVVLQP